MLSVALQTPSTSLQYSCLGEPVAAAGPNKTKELEGRPWLTLPQLHVTLKSV